MICEFSPSGISCRSAANSVRFLLFRENGFDLVRNAADFNRRYPCLFCVIFLFDRKKTLAYKSVGGIFSVEKDRRPLKWKFFGFWFARGFKSVANSPIMGLRVGREGVFCSVCGA